MAENTAIEWCDHTFNPWVGCTKVSPACDHCYAEGWAKRSGSVQWGGERRRTTPANWRKPLQWQAQAAAFQAEHGRPQRVFCASLADVFDNQVPWQWRLDLFDLISRTPNLNWLLLTKRIGNVSKMLDEIQVHGTLGEVFPNVWLGVTICNQAEADRDIPKLLEVDARVRFLSIEPMLGPIHLPSAKAFGLHGFGIHRFGVDWVICGGESGPGARPMHPDWARSLRDQCALAGVPFLFKQWGEWGPFVNESHFTHAGAEKHAHAWVDSKTADSGLCWVIDDDGVWSNWTGEPRGLPDGMEREDDGNLHAAIAVMGNYGKKAAGRLLDGIEHNGYPEVRR